MTRRMITNERMHRESIPMRSTLNILTIVLSLLIAGCEPDQKTPSHEEPSTTAADVYTCPMHPSVVSDRPGACPVCGMALVKRSLQHEATEEQRHALRRVSLSPTQRVVSNITTARVERRTVTKAIELVGVVDVAEPLNATVSARFRGRLERLLAGTTGERVQRGQALFELYSPDLVTAEQEFLLALEASSNGDTRQRTLVEGIRSRLRLNFGMTDEQIAELERTRTVRTTVTFHSPIHGTILTKNINEGDYVEEGTVMYRLADLSKVWIMLDIYEKDLRLVRPGQTVVIRTDSYPGEEFSGKVTFVDPVLDPSSRTATVRTEFANQHGRLKPNMFVSATLEYAQEAPLTIPRRSLLETGRRTVVWAEVDSNVFEPRDIRIGLRGERYVEVLGGIESGTYVAATGGFLIDSESLLQESGGGGDIAHDHASDGVSPVASDMTVAAPANGIVDIRVKGDYSPSVIRVKKGTPLTLRFYRDEKARCTEEVQFAELGIKRSLPAFQTTEVTFTPRHEGTIHFSCGMDMVHGRLIVE